MTTSYQICCTIEFKHSYYVGDRLVDIQLNPDQGTRDEMFNLDIKFRMVGNVLSIFFNPQKVSDLSLSSFPNLSFSIQLTDPYFSNFTDLPLDKPASHYAFQNEAAKSSLSKGPFVSEADIAKNPSDSFSPDFGTISLSLSVPTEENPAPTYQLAFSARKTTWRYYLVDTRGTLSNPSIEASGIPGGFTKLGSQTLPNNEEAIVFSSDPASPIALAKDSQQMITLKNDSETIISHLPYPSVQQIIPVTEDNQVRIYSDMYVYV